MKKKPMSREDGLPNFAISNAGLVLLNPYFRVAFERLGFIKENVFVSEHSRHNAMACLQYLVSGADHGSETGLELNAVLCGAAPGERITESVVVSAEQKDLLDSLIKAAIINWQEIRGTSIAGLRENFLMRDGLLTETDERWNLKVQRRTIDVLVDRYPANFSTIQFPWMNKLLHVTW